MSKYILKELPELIEHKIITEEDASRIRAHYTQNTSVASNRLMVVFSILGSLLTGMGIILIIAHNWDQFPKAVKLVFAFLPLLVSQVACGYFLFGPRQKSQAWREASATLLFFAIASAISIVSQVYNIEGTMGDFLFLWMLLSAPIIYSMRSSMVSLLFIVGITWYACDLSYFNYPQHIAGWYWPLLVVAIGHYYRLFKTPGNFFYFHSWFIGLSMLIALGMFSRQADKLQFISYISLFSAFISFGQFHFMKKHRLITNAFVILGSLGIIFTMLSLSFEWFWTELHELDMIALTRAPEFIPAVGTTLLASLVLYLNIHENGWRNLNMKALSYILFIFLWTIGPFAPLLAQVMINISILAFAVFTLWDGTRQQSFTVLNYGLLILTGLIICRFFDTNMSFIVRGLLFLLLGASFFGANYYLIKIKNKAAA